MGVTDFYAGSRILQPLTGFLGLSLDQVNFIVCSLTAVGLGQLMRRRFCPAKTSPSCRMTLETGFGLLLLLFCFGHQIKYLLLQSSVAYALVAVLPHKQLTCLLVTLWSMGFLAILHLYRQHYDYGGYTLDITGPLMIQTQKLTTLAFNLLDGKRLNDGQKVFIDTHRTHAVQRLPNPIQFYSYTLYFHGVMAGPFVFYNDYIQYIEGYKNRTLPDAKKQLTRALCLAAVHGILIGYVAPQFPYQLVMSQEFQVIPMSRRLLLTTICFFLVRHKYYFAWSISEAAALSAGMGFSGYDRNGEAEWSKVRNYDFLKIETGSSLKLLVDGWNISTTHWLREVFYDRAPAWCRTLLVFVASAFWHGFYPGYYLMFLTFALFTFTSRTLRRQLRPYFQTSLIAAKSYDIFTTVTTNLAMNYAQGPFYLLELESALLFWKPFYFFPHSVAMVVLLSVHLKPKVIERIKLIENKF